MTPDPQITRTPEEIKAAALRDSVRGLLDEQPRLSAAKTFTTGQMVFAAIVVGALAYAIRRSPYDTMVGVIAASMLCYLAVLIDRVVLFTRGARNSPEIRISDEEARAIPDDQLPIYTVFVPAFQEPEVARLIEGLGRLEYPSDKLDIQLLLEEDDTETVELAREALAGGDAPVRIIVVPPRDPRTKPKACNYGLHFAKGEIATIYDAEDHPEPLQLRRAVAAFRKLPSNVACLQAKLAYHNDRQNILTRWFTTEYDQWFGYILPGLMVSSSPIPLGGTSNHIKVEILRRLHAWDPFNVTEDADLGIRLSRSGYRTAILESHTLEEANSDPINWMRQRSRWYKGYLQTFLVHMRSPLRLWSQLGTMGFYRFITVTTGPPLISLINTLFWALGITWIFGAPQSIRVLFPFWLIYPAMISLFFGNAIVIYMGLVTARADRKPQLVLPCLLVPIYWVLMSVAAVKAFVQLVFQPSYWEKTVHGLDSPQRH